MSRPLQRKAALPRLEQTLAQWQHWSCDPPLPGAPHLERQMEGGLSNHNFLVSAAHRRFVVRIDGIDPRQHGLSRSVEYRALESAAANGIAPHPCYFNPEVGALVCEYLAPDSNQAPTPEELADLCRQIHRLPSRHHRLDPGTRIRRYSALLKREQKPLPDRCLAAAVERTVAHCTGSEQVLCHNDLLPANLLRSRGRMHALDWEYCAMGNPWFDLAVAGDGQDYPQDQYDEFVCAYLGRSPTSRDQRQLQCNRIIYRYLELLWHLAQSSDDQVETVLAQRQPIIASLIS